jgi:hypothetical protein
MHFLFFDRRAPLSESLFSDGEIAAAISELPALYQSHAQRALDEPDLARVEEYALSMTGERPASGFIVGLGAPTTKASLWGKVLDEVHEFFCTNSKAYREERTKGVVGFQNVVAVIVSSLGATLNVGVGILSGLVSIALILVSKMGKNAWCKWYSERQASVGNQV